MDAVWTPVTTLSTTSHFRAAETPYENVTYPRDGIVYVDRFWITGPQGGLVFAYYSSLDGVSPQCNSNDRIVSDLASQLYEGCDIRFVPVAYLGHDMACGGRSCLPR